MFTHQHGNLGKQLGWMIVESSGSLVVCCSSAMFSSGFAVYKWIGHVGHVLESKVDIITPENLWMLGELCQTTDCNHRKHLAYMMVVESCQDCNQNLCCSSSIIVVALGNSQSSAHKSLQKHGYEHLPSLPILFGCIFFFAIVGSPPVFVQNFPDHMHRFLVTSPSLARQFQLSAPDSTWGCSSAKLVGEISQLMEVIPIVHINKPWPAPPK